MAKRYLGYGYTNAQGIAKLEFDADGDPLTHSYTGVGAGKIDIVAESGSLQSETYELLDCYKMDNGTSSDYSDIWASSNVTLTRGSEYSTIEETSTSSDSVLAISNIPLTDYRIEVDVKQVDGTGNVVVLQIMKSDYTVINAVEGVNGEWTTLSIDKTNIATNSRVRFVTSGDCTTIQFKNFKLYPI